MAHLSSPRFERACAILLVIALSLLVTISTAGAAVATPGAEGARDCTVAPRTADELAAVRATPEAPAPFRAGPQTMGEPLRPEEQIHLEATVRLFIACGNAGEPLRIYALYSDRYLQRLLNGERSPIETAWPVAQASPTPAGATLVAITSGRRMADGRLGALVTIAIPDAAQPGTFFFTFLPDDDRLLIDDIQRGPETART